MTDECNNAMVYYRDRDRDRDDKSKKEGCYTVCYNEQKHRSLSVNDGMKCRSK